MWCDDYIGATARRLLADITAGIAQHGVVSVGGDPGPDGQPRAERVYAYEVDGLGNARSEFDDPNVPSLLAIPLLGWDGYDKQVGGQLAVLLEGTREGPL